MIYNGGCRFYKNGMVSLAHSVLLLFDIATGFAILSFYSPPLSLPPSRSCVPLLWLPIYKEQRCLFCVFNYLVCNYRRFVALSWFQPFPSAHPSGHVAPVGVSSSYLQQSDAHLLPRPFISFLFDHVVLGCFLHGFFQLHRSQRVYMFWIFHVTPPSRPVGSSVWFNWPLSPPVKIVQDRSFLCRLHHCFRAGCPLQLSHTVVFTVPCCSWFLSGFPLHLRQWVFSYAGDSQLLAAHHGHSAIG